MTTTTPKDADRAALAAEAKRLAHACCGRLLANDANYAALLDMIDRLASLPSAAPVEADALDAKRWRWLREQHQGHTELEFDADGLPIPLEPTALAFTVFMPDPSEQESLIPVGCIPGELDEIVDAAMAATTPKEPTP